MLNGIFENRNCMEGMATFPDNHFDLAIIDCPYGINMMNSDNKSRGKLAVAKDYKKIADKNAPQEEYFSSVVRISKNQIIWGANHFISKLWQAQRLWGFSVDSSCWIVWDKKNYNNDFADCELAWTSFKTSVRKFVFQWNGMLQENMKNKEKRIHPTQKPVQLYKWLLKNYAKECDLILDTHVGSASSLIACEDMGFRYVGYELDKDYYTAAMGRLKKHKEQLRFF
jgi:site-specific DNA-methyltransferase (adenine-specific)